MKPLFTATFSVAFAAFILPWIGRFIPGSAIDLMVRVSLALTVAWFLLLAVGLFRFKKRGFWALVSLPLVIYWPYILSRLVSACAQNIHNCP